MAVCRLSLLVLLKSTIYLVFYYSRNSSVTGVVEYLIPRTELMGRLPRYMKWAHSHCLFVPATPECPSASTSFPSPHVCMSRGHHCSPKLSNCATVPCCFLSSSSNIETDQQPFIVERETPQRISAGNDNLGLPIPVTGFCWSKRSSLSFPWCLHQ